MVTATNRADMPGGSCLGRGVKDGTGVCECTCEPDVTCELMVLILDDGKTWGLAGFIRACLRVFSARPPGRDWSRQPNGRPGGEFVSIRPRPGRCRPARLRPGRSGPGSRQCRCRHCAGTSPRRSADRRTRGGGVQLWRRTGRDRSRRHETAGRRRRRCDGAAFERSRELGQPAGRFGLRAVGAVEPLAQPRRTERRPTLAELSIWPERGDVGADLRDRLLEHAAVLAVGRTARPLRRPSDGTLRWSRASRPLRRSRPRSRSSPPAA